MPPSIGHFFSPGTPDGPAARADGPLRTPAQKALSPIRSGSARNSTRLDTKGDVYQRQTADHVALPHLRHETTTYPQDPWFEKLTRLDVSGIFSRTSRIKIAISNEIAIYDDDALDEAQFATWVKQASQLTGERMWAASVRCVRLSGRRHISPQAWDDREFARPIFLLMRC